MALQGETSVTSGWSWRSGEVLSDGKKANLLHLSSKEVRIIWETVLVSLASVPGKTVEHISGHVEEKVPGSC